MLQHQSGVEDLLRFLESLGLHVGHQKIWVLMAPAIMNRHVYKNQDGQVILLVWKVLLTLGKAFPSQLVLCRNTLVCFLVDSRPNKLMPR